ncbi:riboflavin synthase [Colwellia sp. UCD-KL20]|uniref:riboflavin synthase n=1 Tax=Colwellia sp. UCD-KL20 TaxID=1917165 RepID=UPI00097126FE|nr:riboflavin synthase [Colwellia sp. UCD-KL20]
MFTGIIEAVGQIGTIQINAQGARITVLTGQLDMHDVKLGDSIATNGICLTVVDFSANSFSADVSNETLARTGFAHYKSGQKVNLEKAMLPTTRFGGHMVSGHVDALSEIVAVEHDGNSIHYWVSMPNDLAGYIAEKGSVTIDGTSLTVNSLSENKFRLTIVPHTTEQTIISSYQVGSKVNLEVDLIARYIERLLTHKTAENKQQSGVTHELLARNGFIK